VLGDAVSEAFARARKFLEDKDTAELLELVGQTVPELALGVQTADKRSFPASFGAGKGCEDDVLTGRGVFYVTQSGKVMLDCVSGHYQMTWGYNHPALNAAVAEAMELGVVWDNHANTPSVPVKELAERLVALSGGEDSGLDRVMLGLATGSVACGAALKVMLTRYRTDAARSRLGPPVMLSLIGNYHGTDIVAQTLRGMWPGLLAGLEVVQVEPNDADALEAAFSGYGERVAGFWAEPVMMNREAVLVDKDYLQLARRLCTEHGALMALDEIQTGFWYPGVFLFREFGVTPDLVIVGKGMTAGFHPLAGVIYRHELDILEQYDALSTNGNASLAALVGLCNLSLIEHESDRIARVTQRHNDGLRVLASQFPDLIETVNGYGLLTGMKFCHRADALGFHRTAVKRGLWLRVHAYHPGHRTVLMKYALVADERVVEFVLGLMCGLLDDRPWR
jgi:4-aminobutyrate aminotransferase-like enzyme